MTCIVGLVFNGVCYMGADSAGSVEDKILIRKDKKVFIKDDFIYGFSGSFRMGQLIQYVFNRPVIDNTDIISYLVTTYIPALRKCFSDNNYSRIINNEDIGGIFLLGYKGKLYCIQSDYQVEESIYPFNAIGSGAQVALGSLYSSSLMLPPEEKVLLALKSAEQFVTTVREPMHVMKNK